MPRDQPVGPRAVQQHGDIGDRFVIVMPDPARRQRQLPAGRVKARPGHAQIGAQPGLARVPTGIARQGEQVAFVEFDLTAVLVRDVVVAVAVLWRPDQLRHRFQHIRGVAIAAGHRIAQLGRKPGRCPRHRVVIPAVVANRIDIGPQPGRHGADDAAGQDIGPLPVKRQRGARHVAPDDVVAGGAAMRVGGPFQSGLAPAQPPAADPHHVSHLRGRGRVVLIVAQRLIVADPCPDQPLGGDAFQRQPTP